MSLGFCVFKSKEKKGKRNDASIAMFVITDSDLDNLLFMTYTALDNLLFT